MTNISAARYERLSKCISTSVTTAIEEIIDKSGENNLNLLKKLTEDINVILTCTIKSEQEDYIEKISYDLECALNEKKNLQIQLDKLSKKLKTTKSLLQEQNIAYINKTRELENSLHQTNWKRTVQEGKYRESIKEKENIINNMKKSLKSIRNEIDELKNSILVLNSYYTKQYAKQKLYIERVKQITHESFQNSISTITKQNLESETRSITSFNEQIYKEQARNTSMKNSINRILKTLTEFSPDKAKYNFTADNFTKKEKEFHQFIIDTIQFQKDSAYQSIKQELQLAMPHINLDESTNIVQVISQHCNQELKECQKCSQKQLEIDELSHQIEELKEKLETAHTKVQQIKSQPEEKISYESVITDSDDWEKRRKELERKITTLSKLTKSPLKDMPK